MPRSIKSCGVLVVRGQPPREFLLMVHPDRYDLPKGHLDPGETEIECALRELEEETGIPASAVELDPGFRFETHYSVRPARFNFEPCDKTTVIFLGSLQREVPIRVSEHAAYAWHPWSPPHRIQQNTIDPLLAALEQYWEETGHASPDHDPEKGPSV